MSLKDSLTPKRIILEAIKSKLEGTGVKKITMIFNVLTEKYKVLISCKNSKPEDIKLADNEISMIKKIFINRICRKFKDQPDKEVKSVIIQINFDSDLFDLFIEDTEGTVTKINY